MSKSLEKFMGVMKHHTSVIEARLQTEESGNKIAFMQGQCAGYRRFRTVVSENAGVIIPESESIRGLIEWNDNERKWVCTAREYKNLLEWETYALDIEELLDSVKKPLNDQVEKMKSHLFYDCDKGRELHWVKGWWSMMSAFSDWCALIHEAYAIAKKDYDNSLKLDEED